MLNLLTTVRIFFRGPHCTLLSRARAAAIANRHGSSSSQLPPANADGVSGYGHLLVANRLAVAKGRARNGSHPLQPPPRQSQRHRHRHRRLRRHIAPASYPLEAQGAIPLAAPPLGLKPYPASDIRSPSPAQAKDRKREILRLREELKLLQGMYAHANLAAAVVRLAESHCRRHVN